MIKQKVIPTVFVIWVVVLCSSHTKRNESHALFHSTVGASIPGELPKHTNVAFKEGELLTYRLHYGLLNAGEVTMEVKPQLLEFGGRKVYHIVGKGYTTGTTDWFFKVRDRYETYLDKDALLPWYFVRRVDEGGYKFSQDYVFDHHAKKVDIGGNEKMEIPSGIQDMVSAFYTARNLDLSKAKEGDVFSLTCFMDKEIWPLKIKYIGKQDIETALGKVSSLKFRPVVQKGRVFKQEEDLTVWISDDKNHLPLKVEAQILIGSVKLEITSAKNLANPLHTGN